jgi:hypothetical protein
MLLIKELATTSNGVVVALRNTPLIARLTTNALDAALLSRLLLPPVGAHDMRAALTSVFVQTLLHQDRLVYVVAVSLAFYRGARHGDVGRQTFRGRCQACQQQLKYYTTLYQEQG